MHVDIYERYWILIIVVVLGAFFASLMAGAVFFGVRVPDSTGLINPLELNQTEFASPGVRDLGNNQYEAVIVARKWSFQPNEIRVPVGAEVTFLVTSADITHGFYVEQHNVNVEVVPGVVARVRGIFDEPGEYRFICQEFCGQGHHLMHAVLIVGDEANADAPDTNEATDDAETNQE